MTARPNRRRALNSRRARSLTVGLAAAACLLGAIGIVAPAGAADDPAPSLVVQSVNARGPQVQVQGNLVGSDPSDLAASVKGTEVDSKVTAGPDLPLDAVVVLDNSASLGNATVQLAKQALEPLLPGNGITRSLGLVTTGGGAAVEIGGTTSAQAFQDALDEVEPVGASVTWDGLVRGADLLSEGGIAQRSIILFSASAPTSGTATATTAQGALAQAGAQLNAVVMPRGADVEAIDNMVGGLGGSVVPAADENALAGAFDSMAVQLGGRYLLQFDSPAGASGSTQLTVSAGKLTSTVAYVPGTTKTGSVNLAPPVVESESIVERILGNPLGLIFVVLVGFAAIALFLWTLMNMVLPGSDNLSRRLKVYEDPYGDEAGEEEIPDGSHTTVPIIQRAVEFTGDVADRRGVLQKLEGDLERAGLPLRGAEALFFLAAGVVLVTLLVFALTRNILLTLIVAGLGILVPQGALSFAVRRRCKAFEQQLPDTLTLLAGTLRAGYSIGQGFEAVSTEIDDPMGRELRRVVTETRLGRPLDESLEAVAERMKSDDFSWAVMAIRIQREVGGNLAELLVTVADTMTQRERLRRDVATLTAEGRMSAIVLGLLPPGLGAVMWAINGEYMSKLLTPGLGYILLGLGLVSMLIGFAWMKKIITIEV
ncbi:type II secretion system F family protein [Dermatobacter hominis]|uniref:type II secretion system F family protein n=1 Tax=Dermatobacter hominis TaxID=2884263 RepID=UPI001D101856|nr:type II secretion system F family protein [Dermatobacter hominis]UDY36071.1 type II secretion system F family protein [Dermatobacter hominis]